MRIKRVKLGFACALLALSAAASADAEKGMAAFQAGDYKTALKELNADVKKGDAEAMAMMSRLYAEGKGVKQDHKLAFQWMEKAAKAGSVHGQGSLAMFYSEGIGTAKDDARSLEWGRRAADSGHLISQFIMGMRFSRGIGVERDPQQAMNWWSKAAERGMIRAQAMLGELLAGLALAPDVKPEDASTQRVEAAKWLLLADSARQPGGENFLSSLKEKMTQDEIASAEEKARDWRPAGATK